MTHQDFITEAISHYKMHFIDKYPLMRVFVVWSVKVCRNSKAILADNKTNYMCEATMNGEENEIYYDFYKKAQHEIIKIN